MSRVRLTARDRAATDDSIPFPGNVNQPDRKDKKWDQYHTFEQTVNHELPDMRHEWKNDSRDDIGFGVPEPYGKQPTVASVRVAANKAVRIAVLLLGEKVEDEVVECQARDFMSMSSDAMDRTLARFSDTQKLYAEDKEEVKVEEKKDEVKASVVVKAEKEDQFKTDVKPGAEEDPTNKKASEELADKAQKEEPVKAADEVKVEDVKKDEEKKASEFKAMIAATVAEAIKAAFPDFIQKKVDEKKDDKKEEPKKAADEKVEEKKDEKKEEVKAAADDKKDEVKEEVKAADDKEEKVEEKKEEVKASATDMDIELTGSMDMEGGDVQADERLSAIFDDQNVKAATDLTQSREASGGKAGIKRLGGQPRVAGTTGAGVQDISNIWESAPDVSEAFR